MQRGAFDGIEPMVKTMTLFKKVFPRSYAKLRACNGLFVSCGPHRTAPQPTARYIGKPTDTTDP